MCHNNTTECMTNELPAPLTMALSLPIFNGNWSTYNGIIVNIYDSTCPIFRTFRYDLEWRCCIGTLENTSFIGQLIDDARVILWNNCNTWIKQEARIPNDSLVAYIGLPETETGKSSSHTEQQKPVTNLPTIQHLALNEPQQLSQDQSKGASKKRKREEEVAPLTTQQLQVRIDIPPDPRMTLPHTIIHPAEHCFALNTKT